jgi:hypothetical protein
MPFVDKTHADFKWSDRHDGDTMSYMWQVLVMVLVLVLVL